jgi:protocatechuate 3,4-dioxygenase, beta subunit
LSDIVSPNARLVLPRYPRVVGVHPPHDWPDYVGTRLRHPLLAPFELPQRLTEITGPLLGEGRLGQFDADLTRQHEGEPLGQRIIVHGRVLDEGGHPLPATLIEIWQANAGGRYRHVVDNWPSPIDPNFTGLGRMLTDEQGRYEFTTIRPGAYPWRNSDNAWRPAHIHFSLFGRAFTQRLITQMYFPNDPLFFQDPIFNSVPDPKARERLIARYDHATTKAEWALGFEFDIVLRGPDHTPFENNEAHDDE